MDFTLADNNKNTYQLLLEENMKKYKNNMEQQNPYIRLARESLTHYLLYGEYLNIATYVTEEMKKIKRCFCFNKKSWRIKRLYRNNISYNKEYCFGNNKNAVEAGERDPRFNPIMEDELEDLDFSVDVLTEPEIAIKEELNPKNMGLLLRVVRNQVYYFQL